MSAATSAADPRQEPWLVLPGFPPDTLGFALRTTASMLLAYLFSFWAQLDSASSAGVCVSIVAQPSPGMALSKAFWRLGGTLLGGIAAVALSAVFGQDRTMLLVGFTLWLGLATMAASLLSDFRAYGAALSGYTVGIVSLSDIDMPQAAFDSSINRVAAIAVGIVCVALVNVSFAPGGAWESLVERLRGLVEEITDACVDVLRQGAAPGQDTGRDAPADALGNGAAGDGRTGQAEAGQAEAGDGGTGRADPERGNGADKLGQAASSIRLAAAVLGLRTDASYVAVEKVDGSVRAAGTRSAIAALLGMISAARALQAGLRLHPPDEAMCRALHVVAEALRRPQEPRPDLLAADTAAPPRHEVGGEAGVAGPAGNLLPPAGPGMADSAPSALRLEDAFVLDRLDDLLAQHRLARDGLDSLASGSAPGRHVRLHAHHDVVGAFLNGVRTVVAVALGSLFCIYAGWPNATSMLVQMAAFVALLGIAPNPSLAGRNIALAIPLPMLAAWAVKFGLLPLVAGFAPFAIALAPCCFVFCLMARLPLTAGPGGSMLLYFVLLLSPSNPQDYDLSSFLNLCMAQLAAGLALVLSFWLVLPVSPHRRLFRVAEAISGDLRRRLHATRPPRFADQPSLQSLGYARLATALQWLGRPTVARLAVLGRLQALSELNLALWRARAGVEAAGRSAGLHQAAQDALLALRQPVPGELQRAASRLLAHEQAAGPARAALLRGASGLYGASVLLEAQRPMLRVTGLLRTR